MLFKDRIVSVVRIRTWALRINCNFLFLFLAYHSWTAAPIRQSKRYGGYIIIGSAYFWRLLEAQG